MAGDAGLARLQALAPRRPSWWGRVAGFVLLAGFLVAAAWWVGTSAYSPDSWAYVELSRTVFGGDFYRFNTYRSYFSDDYSAAFPLGYPVLLALVQLATGAQPMVAVAVNILAALASGWVVVRLADARGLAPLTGLALASALLLSPLYLDEVLAGRAIPVAALMLLLSLRAWQSSRALLGGILLGVCALVRFDYLVYAVALQLALGGLQAGERGRPGMLLKYSGGFLLGLLPWVVYSKTHFGSLWVSDNAWVAKSVLPAFVLDYPARAVLSAAEDPQAWLGRVAGNLWPLLQSLSLAAVNVPLLGALAVMLLRPRTARPGQGWAWLPYCVLALLLAVVPYLLTGYVDGRYFSLILLGACALLAVLIETGMAAPARDGAYKALLLLSLLLSCVFAGHHVAKLVKRRPTVAVAQATEALIERLLGCQAIQPGVVYIFKDQHLHLAPRYGALTGQRAAYLPANFHRMTEAEMAGYFARMSPYALIDKHLEPHACPTVH